MPWAHLDDNFWCHPKIVSLPDAAVGVFAKSISYSAGQLTNGRLPKSIVAGWRNPAAVKALVKAKLWEVDGDSYVVHDYTDWNKSREQIEAERTANNQRKKDARKNEGVRPDRPPDVRPDALDGRTPLTATTPDPDVRTGRPSSPPNPPRRARGAKNGLSDQDRVDLAAMQASAIVIGAAAR